MIIIFINCIFYFLEVPKHATELRLGYPKAALFLSRATKGTVLEREAREVLKATGTKVMKAAIYQKQCIADRYFDPVKMEQLIQSVKKYGILENLLGLVSITPTEITLLSGHFIFWRSLRRRMAKQLLLAWYANYQLKCELSEVLMVKSVPDYVKFESYVVVF